MRESQSLGERERALLLSYKVDSHICDVNKTRDPAPSADLVEIDICHIDTPTCGRTGTDSSSTGQ